jgi:hypothetical protein
VRRVSDVSSGAVAAAAYDLALRFPEEASAATALADHTRIVDAIARRDPELASRAMFSHLKILEGLWAEESGYSVVPRLPSFLIDASDPFPSNREMSRDGTASPRA